MNNTEKAVAAGVAAVLTLILVGAGLIQGWAVWVWLPLGLLPPAAALLVTRAIGAERQRQYVFPQPRSPQPGDGQPTDQRMPPSPHQQPYQPHQSQQSQQPARQEILREISLPSAVEDYPFLFSATVYWITDAPQTPSSPEVHANPAALAREAIVARAAELLAEEPPDEYSRVTESLNATLGVVMSVPRGNIYVWAANVFVTLSESDRARLRRLADVRKQEQVWEHEHRHERAVREYLARDVLRDPGRAVVWWLARNVEKDDAGLRSTVGNIDNLRLLTSAAHATEVPDWETTGAVLARGHSTPINSTQDSGEHTRPVVVGSGTGPSDRLPPEPARQFATLLDRLLDGRDDDEKAMFFEHMARLLDTHKMPDYATGLRHRAEAERLDTVDSMERSAPGSGDEDSTVNRDRDGAGGAGRADDANGTGTNGHRTDAPEHVRTSAPFGRGRGPDPAVEQHPGAEPPSGDEPPAPL